MADTYNGVRITEEDDFDLDILEPGKYVYGSCGDANCVHMDLEQRGGGLVWCNFTTHDGRDIKYHAQFSVGTSTSLGRIDKDSASHLAFFRSDSICVNLHAKYGWLYTPERVYCTVLNIPFIVRGSRGYAGGMQVSFSSEFSNFHGRTASVKSQFHSSNDSAVSAAAIIDLMKKTYKNGNETPKLHAGRFLRHYNLAGDISVTAGLHSFDEHAATWKGYRITVTLKETYHVYVMRDIAVGPNLTVQIGNTQIALREITTFSGSVRPIGEPSKSSSRKCGNPKRYYVIDVLKLAKRSCHGAAGSDLADAVARVEQDLMRNGYATWDDVETLKALTRSLVRGPAPYCSTCEKAGHATARCTVTDGASDYYCASDGDYDPVHSIPDVNYVCFKCGQPGGESSSHWIEQCESTALWCYICENRGHTADECESGATSPPPSGYYCGVCGMPGGNEESHWTTSCTEEFHHIPVEGYVCHNCGQQGGKENSHWVYACPQPSAGVPSGGYECDICCSVDEHWTEDCYKPTASYVCHRCGQPGGEPNSHFIHDCPAFVEDNYTCYNCGDENDHFTSECKREFSGDCCHNCGLAGGQPNSHGEWACGVPWRVKPQGNYVCSRCRAVDDHWTDDCWLPTEGYECHRCGQPGGSPDSHWIQDCPQETPKRKLDEHECSRCHSVGEHWSHQCSRPGEGFVCRFCGTKGGQPTSHWHITCPRRSVSPSYECRRCHQIGAHFEDNCQPPPSYTCFNCGMTGDHFLQECVHPRSHKPTGWYECSVCRAVDSHWSSDCLCPSRGYMCHRCGQPGGEPDSHWMPRCTVDGPPIAGYICWKCESVDDHWASECNCPPATYVCHSCGQRGGTPESHWLPNCPHPGGPPVAGYECAKCHAIDDHWRSECNRPPETFVCHSCGQRGGTPESHWLPNCPHPGGPPVAGYECAKCHAIDDHWRSECNRPPETFVCHRCGQPGGTPNAHWIEECES